MRSAIGPGIWTFLASPMYHLEGMVRKYGERSWEVWLSRGGGWRDEEKEHRRHLNMFTTLERGGGGREGRTDRSDKKKEISE